MDGVWCGVAPLAGREVGDVDADGAARDAFLAEDADHAPQDAIVNVEVEWQAFVEAADQAEHHDEVHAAVALLVFGRQGL